MAGPVPKAGYDEDARRPDEVDRLPAELVTVSDPAGVAAEAFRTLRTSLLYSLVDDPPKVIVVTSPGAGEGKSTACANLGVVLAQAEKSTLIVDCDLRKPRMHKMFGLRNFRGVVDVLIGENEPRETYQEPLPGLKVMTTGPVPPNPTELLGSRRFAEFLEKMRREFDYVLVDVPPVQLVSDPVVVATQGDGVLLVLDAQKTRKRAAQRSIVRLESVGAKIIGTTLNNVRSLGGDSYGYADSIYARATG